VRRFDWAIVVSLLREAGFSVGEEREGRVPIYGSGRHAVTNLPSRATCPDGIPELVLMPSLRWLGIDREMFVKRYELEIGERSSQ
jgi:hypothetical protein